MNDELLLQQSAVEIDAELSRQVGDFIETLACMTTMLPSELRAQAIEQIGVVLAFSEEFLARRMPQLALLLLVIAVGFLTLNNREIIIDSLPTSVPEPTTTPTPIPTATATPDAIQSLVARHELTGANVRTVHDLQAPGAQITISSPEGNIIVRFEGFIAEDGTITSSETDTVLITMRLGLFKPEEFRLSRKAVGANKFPSNEIYLVAVWTHETPYPLIFEGNYQTPSQ